MDDVLAMATADAEKPKPTRDEAIGIIGILAQQQVDVEAQLKELEAQVEQKKAELRRICEESLPEAMDMVGMKKFELKSGFKIEIKPYYGASITAEHREDAFAWLERNNHDDIIKCKVEVQFGKGEWELAQEFAEFVRGWNKAPIDPTLNRGVHPQTLKAFVRGEVESGANIPHDLFSVFIGRKATVKRA